MLETSLIVVSVLLAVLCAVLKKAYLQMGKNQDFPSSMPPASQRALRFIADNKGLASVFLTSSLGFFLSIAVVLIQIQLGLWSIAVSFLLIIFLLLVLPAIKVSKLSEKLAANTAPGVRLAIEKVRPLSKKIERFIPSRLLQTQTDSGIYTRQDLEELLKRQKNSAGNQISEEELINLLKRMEFEEKKIKDCMQTKKKSTTVGASEAIGPILIDELHKTGQQYFLVEEEFNNEIIGTLDVAQLVDLKKTGNVKSAMDGKLHYLKDKWTLFDGVEAFFKTGSPVFVVVNSDEDIKGIVSIKDVFSELIGHKQMSEFDLFDNLESVAETSLEDERPTK